MSLRQIPRFSLSAPLFLLVITLLLIGGANLSFFTATPTKVAENSSSSIRQNPWLGIIDEVGAERAYEELKTQYFTQEPIRQHEAAHLFGEALYQKQRATGLLICNRAFGYGCYHGFVAAAITDKGLGIINTLDNQCRVNPETAGGACRHGLGHAILGSLGYTNEDLIEAMRICDTLTARDHFGGCGGGAVMEYHFQVLHTPGNTRKFDPQQPYLPCNSLLEKWRQECYFWQVQWWGEALSQKYGDQKYEEIGILCQKLQEAEERESCFLGIGRLAVDDSNKTVEDVIWRCKKLLVFSGELLCRADAAKIFFSDTENEKKEFAPEFCNDLPAEAARYCLMKARSLGTIS